MVAINVKLTGSVGCNTLVYVVHSLELVLAFPLPWVLSCLYTNYATTIMQMNDKRTYNRLQKPIDDDNNGLYDIIELNESEPIIF